MIYDIQGDPYMIYDIQGDPYMIYDIQGDPKRLTLERRLYRLYFSFSILMVPCIYKII